MIRNLLSEHDIALDVIAGNKPAALTKISAGLALRANIAQKSVASSLFAREKLGSTALGKGIAVPHAMLSDLSYPVVSLTRLVTPIEFDSPDNNPVDLLFALLWPRRNARQFLPNLASVCRMFRNDDLRHALRKARSPAEAFAVMCLEPALFTMPVQSPSIAPCGYSLFETTTDDSKDVMRGPAGCESIDRKPEMYGIECLPHGQRTRWRNSIAKITITRLTAFRRSPKSSCR